MILRSYKGYKYNLDFKLDDILKDKHYYFEQIKKKYFLTNSINFLNINKKYKEELKLFNDFYDSLEELLLSDELKIFLELFTIVEDLKKFNEKEINIQTNLGCRKIKYYNSFNEYNNALYTYLSFHHYHYKEKDYVYKISVMLKNDVEMNVDLNEELNVTLDNVIDSVHEIRQILNSKDRNKLLFLN